MSLALSALLVAATVAPAANADEANRAAGAVDVLQFIPRELHAAVRAGRHGGSLGAHIQKAIDAAQAVGGGVVEFPEGVFPYTRAPLVTKPVTIRGAGRSTVFRLIAPSSFPANQGIRIESDLGKPWTMGTGAVTLGQRAFTLDSAPRGLSVGDTVFVTLGTDLYDGHGEEIVRMFNVVESIAGRVVTLRAGCPEGLPAGRVPHKLYKPVSIAENVTIENIALDHGPGVTKDQEIVVEHARNVKIRNVFGLRTAGAIEFRESENCLAEDIHFGRGDRTLHSASGRIIAGWGSSNIVVRNVRGEDVDGSAVMFESYMKDVLVEDLHVGSGAGAGSLAVLHLVGGSKRLRFRGVTVSASTPRTIVHEAEGAEYEIEKLSVLGGPMRGLTTRFVKGPLVYDGVHYPNVRSATRSITLRANFTDRRVLLPSGLIRRIRAQVSHPGAVAQLWLLNGLGHGANVAAQLVPGQMVDVAVEHCGVGADYRFNSATPEKRLHVYTGSSVPEGATLSVVVDYLDDAGGI